MNFLKNQPSPSLPPSTNQKKTLTPPFLSPFNNEKKVLRKKTNPLPFPFDITP
jgi:hypothetical protein